MPTQVQPTQPQHHRIPPHWTLHHGSTNPVSCTSAPQSEHIYCWTDGWAALRLLKTMTQNSLPSMQVTGMPKMIRCSTPSIAVGWTCITHGRSRPGEIRPSSLGLKLCHNQWPNLMNYQNNETKKLWWAAAVKTYTAVSQPEMEMSWYMGLFHIQ